jgi:hypothetical protein
MFLVLQRVVSPVNDPVLVVREHGLGERATGLALVQPGLAASPNSGRSSQSSVNSVRSIFEEEAGWFEMERVRGSGWKVLRQVAKPTWER